MSARLLAYYQHWFVVSYAHLRRSRRTTLALLWVSGSERRISLSTLPAVCLCDSAQLMLSELCCVTFCKMLATTATTATATFATWTVNEVQLSIPNKYMVCRVCSTFVVVVFLLALRRG
jgi:hypothetical protein